MEKHEEALLQQLEAEGKEIAKYRLDIKNIVYSGKKINLSAMLRVCRTLNSHIEAFDKIDDELSKSETVRLSNPKLKAVGM
ncbi:MAG: hypothetical protein IJ661_06075 [Lachnospiraceae bacterium]|nr:hypothetical protein [Lachnospiraceae bacterium]